MSRRPEQRRRLAPSEVVFTTSSGATLIVTAPDGRPARRTRLRGAVETLVPRRSRAGASDPAFGG
jgi:hypothetical protein